MHINSSIPGQNDRHFADIIFKRILLNKDISISIKASLKFIPNGPISNIPALIQVNIGSDNGLAPTRRQAIIWTNVNPIDWRIFAALGRYELIDLIAAYQFNLRIQLYERVQFTEQPRSTIHTHLIYSCAKIRKTRHRGPLFSLQLSLLLKLYITC